MILKLPQLLLLVAPPVFLLDGGHAFTITTTTTTTSISRHNPWTLSHPPKFYSPQQLYSSVNNIDDDDDDDDDEEMSDELSKLIGKRASISKSKSSSSPSSSSSSSTSSSSKPPPASVLEQEDFIDPNTASLYEGKSGMDIFEMPEFKTVRPLRTPKEVDDKARGGDDASGGGSMDGSLSDYYIDFQADYEDENDLHIPNRMGFTTVVWGDVDAGFKQGKKLKKKEIQMGKFLAGDLQVAYDKLMDHGITLVDTSENYGLASRSKSLSAEHILCQCMDTNMNASPIVASAMSNPWKSLRQGTGFRVGSSAILKAIEASGDRLGTSAMDLYQVPSNMFYIGAPGTVAKALCAAMDQGLINNIGVKNMSKGNMKRFNNKLNKIGGYSITSNQFEFSLVNRKAWKSGLIAACKRMGIIPMASNPLGNGLASGVYTATNPTGGEVSGKQPFDFKTLEKYTTLHDMMLTVQQKVQKRLEKENSALKDRSKRYSGPPINTNVTTTQIAINYIIAKGCVPLPSVKNPKEADEIIGCLGWSLTDDEVKMLDNAADMSDKGRVV